MRSVREWMAVTTSTETVSPQPTGDSIVDDFTNDKSFSVDKLNRTQDSFRLIDMLVRMRFLKNSGATATGDNASVVSYTKSNMAALSQLAADQFGINDLKGLLSDVELACVTQRRAQRERAVHPAQGNNAITENKAFELELKKRLAVHYVRAAETPDISAERGTMVGNMHCISITRVLFTFLFLFAGFASARFQFDNI